MSALPQLDYAALEAEAARRWLREYIGQAWGVIEPGHPYLHNWHIDAISEHLEAVTRGDIKRLVINMPPRSMKSICISVMWPTWLWIRRPEMRLVFASYAASLAQKHSVDRRTIIQSEWYQRNWSRVFQLSGDQNEKREFANDRRGVMVATSVDGTATGKGGDILVADDLVSPQESFSEAERANANRFFDQTLFNRLDDPKQGAIVVVMQRLHDDDLTGHLLRSEKWDHLVLPMEYEGPRSTTSLGWQDPRTTKGELMWPARFGPEEVAAYRRRLGEYGYAGQYQQRPSPAEGGMIKLAWWRRYQQAPTHFDEVIQSWDCAFKDLASSDYVVGQVWGRCGADRYLLDQVRDKMDLPATLAAVRKLSANWPAATVKLIEDKANGSAVIQMLRHEIPGLIAVNPQGGKEARAAAISPQIESGNVYVPATAPWVEAFFAECASFPAGAHDDQVDCMSQALLRLQDTNARQAFPDFRPYGPRLNEPIEAAHVIPGYALQPWWQRFLAVSWGQDSAALWFVLDDKHRLQVYREFFGRGLSAEELSARVGQLSAEEVAASKSLVCWTSPDYFEKHGIKSIAQRLADGFAAVLGDGAAFVWAFTDDERMLEQQRAHESLMQRRKRNAATRITLQAAKGEPAAAVEHLRGLLRFRPLVAAPTLDYDREQAREILAQPDAVAKFSRYMAQVEGRSTEALPKLLVHEACPELIRAMSSATRVEDKIEGGAALEALLCGALAHREGAENRPPMEVFTAQRMEQAKPEDPMSKYLVAKKAENDWQKAKPRPFTFNRLPRRGR